MSVFHPPLRPFLRRLRAPWCWLTNHVARRDWYFAASTQKEPIAEGTRCDRCWKWWPQ